LIMIILKKPVYENDDYLFRLGFDEIPTPEQAIKMLYNINPTQARYYEAKRRAFAEQNINPNVFIDFVEDKPSLRSLSQLGSLESTIYTSAVERENRMGYKELLASVKKHLTEKPETRRCVVRLINGFDDYFDSELKKPADVTCLSLIHYLGSGPKLVFRASDIKNELFVDIMTVYEFFVKPVYDSNFKNLQLSVYSSTAQNVSSWDDFIGSLKAISVEGEV